MTIKKYKNIDTINNARSQVRGQYIKEDDRVLIDINQTKLLETFDRPGTFRDNDKIELFGYSSADVLLKQISAPTYQILNNNLVLNPAKDLRESGLDLGRYKAVYNVYRKLINNTVYIKKISPSRKELLLLPVQRVNTYADFISHIQFVNFGNKLQVDTPVNLHPYDINGDGLINITDITTGIQAGTLNSDEKEVLINHITGGSTPPYFNMNELLNDPENESFPFSDEFKTYIEKLEEAYDDFVTLEPRDLNIYANFGDNKLSLITNWVVDKVNYPEEPHGLIVKLYEPLPDDIQEKTQFSICKLYTKPIVEKVNLVGIPPRQEEFTQLAHHTKDVDINIVRERGMDTFENWNDLLSQNPTTAQNIIDTYLSGSHIESKLNVDYTDYNKFVKFGSAEERLRNFKYKVELIETYTSQSANFASVSSSVTTKTYYTTLRDNLINGFDGYEKFLYNESGSYIQDTTDYQDATWPKSTSTQPYVLYPSTASEVTGWYDNQLANAIDFDNENSDALRKNLPAHIRLDDQNAEFLLFVDMIGQHFDTVWTYAHHLSDISNRGHNIHTEYNFTPDDNGSENIEGLHKDLTYLIGQSFGMKLNNGQDLVKLWKYTLGENQYNIGSVTVSESVLSIHGGSLSSNFSGGTLTIPSSANPAGSDYTSTIGTVHHLSASLNTNYNGAFSTSDYTITFNHSNSQDGKLSANDYTKEIWRRLLNNLPYLVKTKGTARSVKALISCYGIPSTILNIKEYGGPKPKGTSYYVNDRFTYALNFTSSNQYFSLPWKNTSNDRRPDTIQFRFKSDIDWNNNSSSPQNVTLIEAHTGSDSTQWDIQLLPHSGSVGDNTFGSVSDWGYLGFRLSGSDGYKSITSSKLPLYDGDFWSVMLNRSSGSDATDIAQTYNMYVKKAYGDTIPFSSVTTMSFTATTSASYKGAYTASDFIYVTDSGSTAPWFSGSIQEFRLWNKPIAENTFNIHVKAPLAYVGLSTSSFYDELEVRLPFSTPVDHSGIGYVTNIAYTSDYTSSAEVVNFGTKNKSYIPYDIENNFELPKIGGNRWTSNKIRVESSSLRGNLSLTTRAETRANDYAAIDSPKLDVQFSPQQAINEDIIADFGGIDFDDFIGDPGDVYNSEYPALKKVRDHYFKRYDIKNDFFEYIRLIQAFDFTLFEQIKNLLPHRAHASVGVVIEPHLLERSKHDRWKPLTRENTSYLGEAHKTTASVESEYEAYTGETGKLADKWTGTLTQYTGLVESYLYSGSKTEVDDINSVINYTAYTITGRVPTGDQTMAITNYLGEVETDDYHLGTTYYTGSGKEEEAIHPYTFKQRLSSLHLVHTGSTQPIRQFGGVIVHKPIIEYGYYDNDRSITGSIPNEMAVRGYVPYEYNPAYNTARINQKYNGMLNDIHTTYDGKEAVEIFETAPSQLVVSKTTGKTLKVK